MNIKKFVIMLLLVTAFCAILGYIIFSYFLENLYHPIYPVVLLVFLVFTLLSHFIQIRLIRKDINRFSRTNLIMTFLKLILYSAITILFIYKNPDFAIPFVVIVMVLYIVYTFLEVKDLTSTVRKESKRKQ